MPWIERGAMVELKCEGDGNPQPELVVKENTFDEITRGGEKQGAWTFLQFRKLFRMFYFYCINKSFMYRRACFKSKRY